MTVLPLDTVGAFIVGPRVLVTGALFGPLAGRTFAVKDLLDIEGYATGGGNPDWLTDAPLATSTAPAVQRLLDAGATLVGKTHTDELAYSLAGTNVHYGTPQNTKAPGRIPGGSSSGSAAAVGAGLVDVALGTDTGGSIRVPASYCGVFGLRPSWGRVPVDGLMALAASYDTVGVFAADATQTREAAIALFGGKAETTPPANALVLADDAWALTDPAAAEALRGVLLGTDLPMESVDLAGSSGGLAAWLQAFRAIQGSEAWMARGEWITSRRPALGPGVARRFEAGSRVTPAGLAAAELVRQAATERICSLLEGDRVLAIPSTCGPAPSLDAPQAMSEDIRERTLRLTCIAGHAGAPVVSVPAATVDGLPVGLSLIGMPGHDEQVLDLAVALGGGG